MLTTASTNHLRTLKIAHFKIPDKIGLSKLKALFTRPLLSFSVSTAAPVTVLQDSTEILQDFCPGSTAAHNTSASVPTATPGITRLGPGSCRQRDLQDSTEILQDFCPVSIAAHNTHASSPAATPGTETARADESPTESCRISQQSYRIYVQVQ